MESMKHMNEVKDSVENINDRMTRLEDLLMKVLTKTLNSEDAQNTMAPSPIPTSISPSKREAWQPTPAETSNMSYEENDEHETLRRMKLAQQEMERRIYYDNPDNYEKEAL